MANSLLRRMTPTPDFFSSFPHNGAILRSALQKSKIPTSLSGENSAKTLMDVADLLTEMPEGKEAGFVDRIYRTSSHTDLYGFVGQHIAHLAKGVYQGKRGVHSHTVVGAKGIGKTTVLSKFVDLAPIFFPNVIPVYLNFNNINAHGSYLAKTPLAQVISEQLALHNVFPPKGLEELTSAKNLHALREANQYMVLMVDELDQLYRQRSNINHYHTNLADLAYLGNQDSGRVLTIVCGSSAALPQLITCGVIDYDEFPTSKGALNLNSDKYRTFRIRSHPPTEWNHIPSILPELDATKPEHIPILRTVAFLTGGTARKVTQVTQGFKLDDVLPHRSEKGYKTLDDPIKMAFWDRVTYQMIKQNATLFDKLIRSGELSVDSIGQIEWEKEFMPLSGQDIRQIVREMELDKNLLEMANKTNYKTLALNPLTLVHHFCDRSWLAYAGVSNSFPDKIYPISLLMLTEMYYTQKIGRAHV